MRIEELLKQADHLLNLGDTKGAELRCAEVLGIRPDFPPALNLMGLIAHRSGDLDRAIAHIQRACSAKNVPPGWFSNLAEMLRQRGRRTEAEEAARTAIAKDENFLPAWNNLGIILQEQGKFDESRESFARVLSKEPNNAQTHSNLGTTFKRMGLEDKAEAHWKKALQIDPEFSTAASNLTSLYNEWGEVEKAVEFGLKAVRGKNPLPDAFLNLAAAENARTNYAGALSILDRLLARNANDARAHAYRAMVLRQINRLDEALAAAERAIALAPESGEARFIHATVLKTLERDDEALLAYARAAEISSPVQEQAMIGRAQLLGEMGRTKDALAAFDSMIARMPRAASPYFYRGDYMTYKAGDPAILAMQALLEANKGMSRAAAMSLHFALGKAFLDIGDSNAAFRHLNEGNRLKRGTFSYDAKATGRRIEEIIAANPREKIETAGVGGAKSDMPIFIVGMPRSGTTLIEQILAAHSHVHGAGELKDIDALAERSGGSPDALSKLGPEGVAAFGEKYLARVKALSKGKPRVVDKMPSNFLHAGFIRMILPEAKIIHVVRDPVDTCLSCYTKLFSGEQAFTYNLEELGQFYQDYEKLMAHWRNVIPPDKFLDVRYEDVVAGLEGQARRIVAFLGLPWEESCLEFYRGSRTVRTSSLNQVRQPVYRTAMGRWRAHTNNLKPLLEALNIPAEKPI